MKTSKHTRTALLIFLLLPLLAVECYDEPFAPKLPQATQSGEGMMAAKVNGVVWIAEGGLIGDNPEARYNKENGNMSLQGTMRKSEGPPSIFIRLSNVFSEGEYFAWGLDPFPDGTSIRFNSPTHQFCQAHRSNPGRIEITMLDTIQKIVSGTFEFDGICENGDTVNVTQGRFDVTYSY